MDIMGLDLHKRESQLAIKAEDGTITERRIVTSRERFSAVLGGGGRASRLWIDDATTRHSRARVLRASPSTPCERGGLPLG